MSKREKISPFSVMLITAAVAIIGLLSARYLSIHYTPQEKPEAVTVRFYYQDASSRLVESSVTSVIEGALSKLGGCVGTSSVSSKGYGYVTVNFARGTNMEVVRFEIATQIRNIYPSLPKGVSYPSISIGTAGTKSTESIVFLLKGNIPSIELNNYANEYLVKPLSDIKGVDRVDLRGYTPYHWVITYDADKIAANGISADDIASAISDYYDSEIIGIGEDGEQERVTVYLQTDNAEDFGRIPIAKSSNKIIYLSDVADCRYQESKPSSYYRINGLNTISLTVYTTESANNIKVAKEVKQTMSALSKEIPSAVSYSIGYDSSVFISTELNKIYRRTALSLLVLLLFVLISYRSFRYMFAVGLTIFVNILIAILLYYLLDLQIHLYSLAGITVSLGIIIDSSIVMTDHYSYYKNRSVFVAIFGAVATTIASLMAVLLIPYNQRLNLTDFISAVSINLFISLLVAYFFVPALMSYLPASDKIKKTSYRRLRRVAVWNRFYGKYIRFASRLKWAYIVVLIAGFGVPLCLIPSKSDIQISKDKKYSPLIEKIANWGPYARNKTSIDRIVSSSFGVFYRSLNRFDFGRTPQRKVLNIRTGLSEGHTVDQMNDVVRQMENFLAQFNEIELFRTNVWSYDNASIDVYFKPEYEKGIAPITIKSEVIKGATNFGGANWIVSGIDERNFNNYIGTTGGSDAIDLYGYDYDELLGYAERLISFLKTNPRVKLAHIRSSWMEAPRTEYNLSYNFETLAALGVNPYSYYSILNNLLYSSSFSIAPKGERVGVLLKSSQADYYDLWHTLNAPIVADSSLVTLSEVGKIVKKRTDLDITRENQSYKVMVNYDFIGEYNLNTKLRDRALAYMNGEVLPIGYKAEVSNFNFWFEKGKANYGWLILVIIIIIYVMLSILFESFRLPVAVLIMIPISFIGVFLIFGFSSLVFDQGGFAALIMLCGIVVNAGIYLIWSYIGGKRACIKESISPAERRNSELRAYLKSYNQKIRPIFLTIISTILGLVPFLVDGPQEVFWYDFAIGTITGLLFSLIALILYMPLFTIKKSRL